MSYLRLVIGACFALIVTTGLIFVMQHLIQNEYVAFEDTKSRKIADIQMGDTEIETKVEERKPDKPDDAEEPPPAMEPVELNDTMESVDTLNIAPTLKNDGQFNKGPGLSASDGEYLPMVKVLPQYPRRALSRGVEGYCIVSYTVTKTGATEDPVAIDCVPKGMFERASVKAALKFKYKPRVEDGEPIEVKGVKNKFTYKLAK